MFYLPFTVLRSSDIEIAHFRVALSLSSLSKRGLVHNHSYENEFNLHENEISFSYEKMGTKTRFEEEAKGNSEMAYYSRDYSLICTSLGPITITYRYIEQGNKTKK